jgi:membrane carboxypeptidase/penicillin-binding protein
VTEPHTGQIFGDGGIKRLFASDIDGKYNVTTAMRQPGSSIKPINYAIAIDSGKITAASILYDGPNCFKSKVKSHIVRLIMAITISEFKT